MEPYPELLQKYLDRRGWNLTTLAEKAGVSRGFPSSVVNDHCPMPLDRIAEWARLLELSPTEFRDFLLAAALTHVASAKRQEMLGALPPGSIDDHPLVVALRQENEQLRERLSDISRRARSLDQELPASPASLDRRLLDESERGDDAAPRAEALGVEQAPQRRPKVS